MRQPLREVDAQDDGFGLAGETRGDEYPAANGRLPKVLLTVAAMAVFSGGLWFAYVQGTRHPSLPSQGTDGVPLIRADDRPIKVKPDQPGGMAVPDQNVSLYNDKQPTAGIEKLLPGPEQPLPRPAAPPSGAKEATAGPPISAVAPPPPAPAASPAPSPPAPSGSPAQAAAAPAQPPKPPAKQPTAPSKAAAEAQAILAHAATGAAPTAAVSASGAAPVAAAVSAGAVQIRLGSLRSPEEARDEWARLKRENADLLGRLSANAVRTDLGDKGIYYRIEAGPFQDAAAAERLCGELKRRKLGCLLAR